MSTSELRRGPGWWMDLEGHWNPPEEWPESNPPLPGWVRNADGFWCEPAISAADLEAPTDGLDVGATERPKLRSIPDLNTPITIPSLRSLTEVTKERATDLGENEHPPHLRLAPATSSVGLSFSESTVDLAVFDENIRLRRHAIIAALVAGVTASMLATGLVLLLLLL